MAETDVVITSSPTARLASVDYDFGGTMAARHVQIATPKHYVMRGYLVVGREMQSADAIYRVAATDNAFYTPQRDCVIVGQKTIALAGDVSAATLSWPSEPLRRPRFVAELPSYAAEYWRSGLAERPSVFVSLKVRDRRLTPFYEVLSRIERGTWDVRLEDAPSKAAISKAKAILDRLQGGAIVPTRVVAADGIIVIYFSGGQKYSNIEVLNDGAMLALNSDGQTVPAVKRFTMRSLSSVIDQIRAHVA